MARLIDATVFIELERRGQPLSVLEAAIPGEAVALAAITASELLAGVHRAVPSERRRRREAFVETVLAQFPVFPFDLRVARLHALVLAELTAAGQLIGLNDLMIATTALVYGYEILTLNVREFERVPGLVVRRPDW